jgi:hypothetical protein
MIALPLPTLLWLLVLVPLGLLLLLSAVLPSFRSERRGPDRQANIYRCEHCRLVYVDERKVPLSRCPRCRRLNESLRR